MEQKSRRPIERRQIGVRIDMALWRELKIEALRQGKDAFEVLEEVIKQYLKNQGKDAP